jgi:hypothetical protein
VIPIDKRKVLEIDVDPDEAAANIRERVRYPKYFDLTAQRERDRRSKMRDIGADIEEAEQARWADEMLTAAPLDPIQPKTPIH